ncbi:hypothetical protein DFR39_101641 [Roseateles asaccharophilus]|uniref:Uncharacterized protein n=1 Tax=Roseateles asaccharophilus TaxID=582607 RepID=A0A4V6PU93_9BURK|nr:hypothetical protein DFR39_101641 [Roseateles asaccharophilus]
MRALPPAPAEDEHAGAPINSAEAAVLTVTSAGAIPGQPHSDGRVASRSSASRTHATASSGAVRHISI